MRGLISFHPVDLGFFDDLIEPLAAGEKVNPEGFLDAARRLRSAAWASRGYQLALKLLLEQAEPPPPPAGGTVWEKVRARLERFDHRPSPLVRLVAGGIDPDLHLEGRPFLVTEGSAERVATIAAEFAAADGDKAVRALLLEQLARIDPLLAREVQPEASEPPSADMTYRTELLRELKEIFDLGHAARNGLTWGTPGEREPAADAIARELPHRAMELHSRAVPCWIAGGVDGLEMVCRAAGIEPPGCLVPAWRLFARTSEDFPVLRDALSTDLERTATMGAFAGADDVAELLDFLGDQGSRIIQAATRHGEGGRCSALLRKIRECATFARKNGMGYLEATGIVPVAVDAEEREPDAALAY